MLKVTAACPIDESVKAPKPTASTANRRQRSEELKS
jgi:hypothetical protein